MRFPIALGRGDSIELCTGEKFTVAENMTLDSYDDAMLVYVNGIDVQFWERNCLGKTLIKRIGKVRRENANSYAHRV